MEAGKRPRITLTPTLVTKQGRPVLAIDFGMQDAEAVTAPRFSTGRHQYSFNPNPNRPATYFDVNALRINADVPEPVRAELERRGHKVKTTTGAIGQPCMIYFDQANDVLYAAGDPKAQRHAAAFND